jgi:hypothetical protein
MEGNESLHAKYLRLRKVSKMVVKSTETLSLHSSPILAMNIKGINKAITSYLFLNS